MNILDIAGADLKINQLYLSCPFYKMDVIIASTEWKIIDLDKFKNNSLLAINAYFEDVRDFIKKTPFEDKAEVFLDEMVCKLTNEQNLILRMFQEYTEGFINQKDLPHGYFLNAENRLVNAAGTPLINEEDEILADYSDQAFKPAILTISYLYGILVGAFERVKLELYQSIESPVNTTDLNGTQSFFFEYNKLTPIYTMCINEEIINENYRLTDFINCFDTNNQANVYPIFNARKKVMFVYILGEIKRISNITNFDKLVKNNLGIGNYYETIRSAKPSLRFKNLVSGVLK
ncbi:hypothetical protein WG904_11100 [Pedobacter sp. Du54]|uniref:hypothetical protein n=1 Tax=Pedobacter anseongensis TaxID=3133439 RepID=UPI0030A0C1A6